MSNKFYVLYLFCFNSLFQKQHQSYATTHLSRTKVYERLFWKGLRRNLRWNQHLGGIKWDSFREAMTSTASEEIPVKEKKSRNKWLTQEILDLMKKRQKIKPRDSREYKDLDKDIKKRCLEAKESWWNRQCQEIEMEPTSAYKKIWLVVTTPARFSLTSIPIPVSHFPYVYSSCHCIENPIRGPT